METSNTDQQSQLNQSSPQVQPSSNIVPNQKGNFIIPIGIIFLILVMGIGAYYLGTNRTINSDSQKSTNVPSVTQLTPTVQPSQSSYTNALGVAIWSLADVGNEVYLKQTISISSDKVVYPI